MNLDAVMDYLSFVEQRHLVWEHRQAGDPTPWTSDPLILSRKFTNVYRVLDYGSQFLLRELLLRDQPAYEDTLMRCFLYRFTNRPEPWEFFDLAQGRYPTVEDLADGTLLETWQTYRGEPIIKPAQRRYDKPVGRDGRTTAGFPNPVFGPAYNLYCGSENPGVDKMEWFLENARVHMPRVVTSFGKATSQQARFDVLQSVPRCGEFLSMQVLTDFGYSPWAEGDLENDFIVAGPGAVKGAKIVAPEWDPVKTIRWAQGELDISVAMPDGTRRPPSLMDVQNTFCEFSKYHRYQGQAIPKNQYHPAHPGPQPTPIYPKHWSR